MEKKTFFFKLGQLLEAFAREANHRWSTNWKIKSGNKNKSLKFHRVPLIFCFWIKNFSQSVSRLENKFLKSAVSKFLSDSFFFILCQFRITFVTNFELKISFSKSLITLVKDFSVGVYAVVLWSMCFPLIPMVWFRISLPIQLHLFLHYVYLPKIKCTLNYKRKKPRLV